MSNPAQDETADAGPPSDASNGSFVGLLASGAWKLAIGAPRMAAEIAHKGLSEAERYALSTLRRRMDAVKETYEAPTEEDESTFASPPGPRPAEGSASGAQSTPRRVTAAEHMARLLEDSLEQTEAEARERVALRIARQLVPDEARILAALADGHPVALMHLGAGPMVGPATQRWLENLSPIGREAGVRLIPETPHYVGHLRDLGLLESGDEDKTMQLKYQLMEADTLVRQTCTEIERAGLRPRFYRRTLRISEAGKSFWAACEPPEAESWKR